MRHCARCGLPTTYETLELSASGVCNICLASDVRSNEDWKAKRATLTELVESYRGRHPYDCIVPFSGGKDSTFTLWYIVEVLKLKPLVVQADHGFFRQGVLDNNRRTFKRLGVEVQKFTPNWHLVKRVMREAFLRKTDGCWHCHSLIFAYPMQVALKERTPLIIWGEPSSQYTSYYKPGEVEEVDEKRFDMFTNLGISAEDMAGMIKHDSDFDFRDLAPFVFPKKADLMALGVRSICLGSYIPWNPAAQSDVITDVLGWKWDRAEGMPGRYGYEKIECEMQGTRDYIKWLKRGYGRVSQMVALDRRAGRMTKEKGDELIAEYEGKRPASLDIFLENIGLTEDEFCEVITSGVVPPHTPDFNAPRGLPTHDFEQWYRDL